MPTRCTRRFTLIELLVVIAVITILVALLLPVLSRAKFQARVVTCMSQQRQWGIALNMYAEDNAGRFPAQPISANVGRNPWGIGAAFYDVMVSDYSTPLDIWGCTLRPVTTDWVNWFRSSHGMVMLGYCYWVPHDCATGPMVDPLVAGPARTTDDRATDHPLLTDHASHWGNLPWYEMTNHMWNGELYNVNHLYLDGSVRTVRRAQIQLRQSYHYNVYY
jgi:type II secretory pathway pseudopilin PulG